MFSKKTSKTFVYLSSLLALISAILVVWVMHITLQNIYRNVVLGKFASTSGVALTHAVVLILGLVSLLYAFLAIKQPRDFLNDHLYDLSVRVACRYSLATLCLNPAVLLVLFRFALP